MQLREVTPRPGNVYAQELTNLDLKEPIDFNRLWNRSPESMLRFISVHTHHQVEGLNALNEEAIRDGDPLPLYNRHDGPHLEHLITTSLNSLEIAAKITGKAVTDDDVKLVILSAYWHDLGNNHVRKDHSIKSVSMFKDQFTNYDPQDPRIQALLWTIKMHDEPYGSKWEDFAQLPEEIMPYRRAIWAFIAADKMDIGRHRLSKNLLEKLPQHHETVANKVPHTQAVLFARDYEFELAPEEAGVGVFRINFSTKEDEEDQKSPETVAILSKYPTDNQGHHRITIPNVWEERENEYVRSYSHNIKVLYLDRFAMMASCLFALFDNPEDKSNSVNTLRVEFKDNQRGITIADNYHRDTWKAQMITQWQALKPHKEIPLILKHA